MKKSILTLSVLLFLNYSSIGQQAYYNDVDLTLTGQDLYFELQNKIDQASSSFTYGDIRDSVKVTDENPENTSDVLLIYGFSDTDGNCKTDRSRNKNDFGGSVCEYNREHVFARSNANPSMGSVDNGSTGIGADPHNIRPSDQQMNGDKGNKKFADGSGNSGNVGSGNWFPGDEWKGDVARIMMYMYTRYGARCLPSLNGTGALQGSTQMLQLYLQWNVEDPVSEVEDQRNPQLESIYGNRNPFIDNPYLATVIWGGIPAEDRWDFFNINQFNKLNITLYPNPVSQKLYVTSTTLDTQSISYKIVAIDGKTIIPLTKISNQINISKLAPGIYIIKLISGDNTLAKRIIIK